MIWLPLKRQWFLVTFFAVIFFVGNVILLSKFSGSIQHLITNAPKANDKEDAMKLILGNSQAKDGLDLAPSEKKSTPLGKKVSVRPTLIEKSMLAPNTTARNGQSEDISVKPRTTKQKAPNGYLPIHYTFKTAVLVIACNRPSVGRCLDRLLKYKPMNVDLPILVSQDCGDEATSRVIQSYGKKVKHLKHPYLGNVQDVPLDMSHYMGYYKISRHYKWALTQVFSISGIDSVIIVEDDLDIAPDFFEYFLATRPLLDQDPSLFCVSAWNDNGKEGYVEDNSLLYRTDFFPGLGWMLTKKIWEELKPKWPKGFWDDWMRHPHQRKDRACIAPEISRTKTFGRVGVSMGQFFDQYLKFIKLNKNPFPFLQRDLSYLLKVKYDRQFLDKVYASPDVSMTDILQGIIKSGPVRTTYTSNKAFELAARQIGIMHDLKAGVPRMAYRGIVAFVRKGVRVYLSPPPGWSGYVE